jgi:hypothetical protein
VEVWFPDVGWQGFDPTAGVPLAADDTTEPAPDDGVDWWPLVALVVGGTVLAAAMGLLVRRRRRHPSATSGDPVADWTSSTSRVLVSTARRAGVETAPPRTIREIGHDLVARGADADVRALVEVLDRTAFGGGEVSAWERERFDALLRELESWEPPADAQDEQESMEQPGRVRAQSGRLPE